MPTAISMGAGALTRISPRVRNMPAMTSGQAISSSTIPLAISDINPAWGADRASEPIV